MKKRNIMVQLISYEALKDSTGVTTPFRVCANSLMKYKGVCLNNLMCKVLSFNSQWDMLVKFRLHKIILFMDIKRFFSFQKIFA